MIISSQNFSSIFFFSLSSLIVLVLQKFYLDTLLSTGRSDIDTVSHHLLFFRESDLKYSYDFSRLENHLYRERFLMVPFSRREGTVGVV